MDHLHPVNEFLLFAPTDGTTVSSGLSLSGAGPSRLETVHMEWGNS